MTGPLIGTKRWLRAAGIHPRKAWGQNFLINPRVAARIVQRWALPPGHPVVEIGAGAGSLTLPLLAQGALVVAVEKDEALCDLLRRRAAAECPAGELRIVAGDVLQLDPSLLLAGVTVGRQPVLVGNLPYKLTTPILEWTTRHRHHFRWAAFMVQREYGERLLAECRSPAYGALTLWMRFYFAGSRECIVGPANFYPVPKVDSVVVRLVPHAVPPEQVPSAALFERVVRAAFAQRRKVIGAALAHTLDLPRERIEAALAEVGLAGQRRAEECGLAQFAALTRALAPLLPPDPPGSRLRRLGARARMGRATRSGREDG